MGYLHDDDSNRAPGRLVARTVQVADPGDLIGRMPGPDALAWVRRGDGLVGWGTLARITLPAGHDRFAAGEKWLRELFDTALVTDEVDLPGSGPVTFGSFTFDPASDGSVLVVPRAVLGRKGDTAWLTTMTAESEHSGDDPHGAADPPATIDDWPQAAPLHAPTGLRWSDGNLTAPDWERAVATAVDVISRGELRKVVLAMELNVTSPQDLDPRVLLTRLVERYPDCYAFSCSGLVGATPELLIRRTGRQLYSLVLAGTVPRGSTPEQDRALGETLLASAKDQEEHQYAVADVRAALSPLCADLRIETEPSLLHLANVQHLATEVHGELAIGEAAKYSALALAAALHPTAAVCGTPADQAMDLIRELECMDRARWSGPTGWVDSRGNGEWGIALRCGEVAGRHARLIAGAGIVAGSVPAAELAEAQAKFWPMRYALEG